MTKIITLLFLTVLSFGAFAAGHTVTVNSTNAYCFGSCDGTAIISVSGGVGPFSNSWSSGGTGTTEINLCAGAYSVTVLDSSDMSTTTANFTILQPTQIVVNTTSNPASCGGVCDGSATVMFSGGTAPYTWSWSPGGMWGTTLTNLCPGTYTVTVTDANGCSETGFTMVTTSGGSISGLTVSDSIHNETCLASGDGAIDITLSGSNPGPFTFMWNNGQTTMDALNLESNLYTLVIYDTSMNCQAQSYQVQADGVNCGGISGTIFADNNTDCVNNIGDVGLSNIMVVTTPGGYQAISNSSGNYYFNNLPYGSYSLAQVIGNPYVSGNSACIGTINATINGSTPFLNNQNFADTIAITSGPDLSITGTFGFLRPGFSSGISLFLNNLTTITASGTVSTTLPNGFGALVTSGTPAGYIVSGDTVSWNYSGLGYGIAVFNVNFTVPVITPIGIVFTNCATALVMGGDADPLNNYYCFSRMVMGSYDPNDKAVSPVGTGPEGNITLSDNELTYKIRFQNTGNAEAINIAVLDTLSDKLDLSTLEVIAASHNYELDIMTGNVLKWKFDYIMLPDSNSNEPGSHGWILYKIKQSSGNVIGDEIRNTAYIYFDFNEAVITNTTLNTIASPVGIESIISNTGNIKVYPNPFSESTTFVIQADKLNENYSFQLIDVLGKTVQSINNISEKQFAISRNGLQNGIYFYSITNAGSPIGKGKIIIK